MTEEIREEVSQPLLIVTYLPTERLSIFPSTETNDQRSKNKDGSEDEITIAKV